MVGDYIGFLVKVGVATFVTTFLVISTLGFWLAVIHGP